MKDGFAVDKWLLIAVAGLLVVGVTMVLSTSYLYADERFADGTYFFRKQLIAAGIGVIGLIACVLVPPAAYRRLAYPLLGLTLLILILVLIPGIGALRGGARRWLTLPGFAFQPAELAKLALVIYLAHSMAKKEDRINTFAVGVLPHLIVTGVFLGPAFGAGLWHRADSRHAALFDAVHRRRARPPFARHRAVGVAGVGLRHAHSSISGAPADDFLGSLARSAEQRLPSHPVAHRLRFRAVLGTRPGGEPAKTFLSARGAHRFCFFGDRRGDGLVGRVDVLGFSA